MVNHTLFVVGAFGSDVERIRWRLDGKTLLERTLKLIRSISKTAETVILTDDIERIRDICVDERVVEVAKTSTFLQNKETIRKWSALAFIDPLRPLIQPKDLESALSEFFSPKKEDRRTVVSVSSVPNHYHPRKVLNIDADGLLEHYDTSGQMVYQRQQIEDDPYYVINDAMRIISPENVLQHETCDRCRGVVIENAVLCIKSKNDLKLASRLLDDLGVIF